jgi:hypothetical protein
MKGIIFFGYYHYEKELVRKTWKNCIIWPNSRMSIERLSIIFRCLMSKYFIILIIIISIIIIIRS